MEEIIVTITVEGDEQAEKLLDVLREGEAEGKLDFAFEVRTDRVEPLHRGTARRTTKKIKPRPRIPRHLAQNKAGVGSY